MEDNISNFITSKNIITGVGVINNIGVEVKKLKASKILIIADEIIIKNNLIDKIRNPLFEHGYIADIINEVTPEPPFENLENIYEAIKDKNYDLLIGVGGGSALDITKVLSVMLTNDENVRNFIGINNISNNGVNTILVPTTAGTGSEVTYNAIFTDNRDGVKKGIVSQYLLPEIAIVDPEMTMTLPAHVTAATGLDALVHAIESYIAKNSNEITDGLSRHAIQLISEYLRRAVYDGEDMTSRYYMSMGSLIAGISLANAGVGAVHALAYPLGGKYHIPHGVANALLLPYVMQYNKLANLKKFKEIAILMGENVESLSDREAANKAIDAMKYLSKDIGIPLTLQEVGIEEEDLKALAEEANKVDRLLNNNIRKLTFEDIYQIYRNAYYGEL